MPIPIRDFQTADWGTGTYLVAMTRDELRRRLIEDAAQGRKRAIRLKRRKKKDRIYDPPDAMEVNYVSALDQLRNKKRVEIQWAPCPS